MNLLQDAMIIIVKILIAVGDATLLVLSSIVRFLKRTIKRIVNSVKLILRFFARAYKRTIDTFLGLRRFKIRRKEKIIKPERKKIKKARKRRKIQAA